MSKRLDSRILRIAILTVLVLALPELVVRVYLSGEGAPGVEAGSELPDLRGRRAAFKVDTMRKRTVVRPLREDDGVRRFTPNEILTDIDVDTGEPFEIAINRHGFRGPDFESEKEAETIRVVALGSSTTFGTSSPDAETYPRQLARALALRCPQRRFEVLNLGIPGASIADVRILFEVIAAPLDPDVVLFVGGENDSLWGETPLFVHEHGKRPRAARSLLSHLAEWSVLARVLDGELQLPPRDIGPGLAELDALVAVKAAVLLENLGLIVQECDRRGILFLPATLQSTAGPSLPISATDRTRLRGITLGRELMGIYGRWEEAGSVNPWEARLLVHESLQNELRMWAVQRGLDVVDLIQALDQERHLLVSSAHLHPLANTIVADAFADEIASSLCQP